jgi:(S)-2-hydroxy-acid oxidase
MTATKPVCISDLEEHARKHLPKQVYDYYASGGNDMVTLRDNQAAFDRCVAGQTLRRQ